VNNDTADHHQTEVFAIRHPSPALLKYYVLSSFIVGPLFFIPLIYFYFRYHTMRYSFDEEGISMKWGILFRREIMLTYARIQDIHLTSNIVERGRRLAPLHNQTPRASASAEMTIEGLHEFEMVRDFLYSKMRGVRHAPGTAGSPAVPAPAEQNDLAAALREVAAELRAVREGLERRRS
jgi:membrane protein YdbS with pleckstrin-like domain